MLEVIKRNFIIILVFILTLSVRIFWICQKDYAYIDEAVSFSVISPNTLHNGKPFKTSDCSIFNFEKDRVYSTKEIKTLLFNNNGDFKSLISDLKSLYLHHYDGGHTNFYYLLFRLWASNLDDVNTSKIILYGCTFNLLFFSLSFFMLFKLLQLIINDKKYIPVALLLSFLSSASVSSILLIREYQMQTFGMILVSYIFCKLYMWICENKNLAILDKKHIILYSSAFAYYFLTGYYSVIYALFLLIALCFIIYKNFKFNKFDILKLLSIIVLSIILIFTIDKNYLNMSHEFVNASNDSFTSFFLIDWSLFTAFDMLQKTVFYPILLIFITLLFLFAKIKYKQNNQQLLLIIFTTAFIWSCTVLLITPYFDIRYFIPAAPLLALGFIYILKLYDFKYTIIFCIISFILILIPNVRFNNFDTIRPFLFYVHDRDNFVFNNKSNLPIVFKDYYVTMPSIILNTDDTQKVVYTDKIPDKNFMYKLYILFIFKGNIDKYYNEIYKNNVEYFSCEKFNDCYAIINNN